MMTKKKVETLEKEELPWIKIQLQRDMTFRVTSDFASASSDMRYMMLVILLRFIWNFILTMSAGSIVDNKKKEEEKLSE
jgi:hypothetical protein